MSWQEAMISEYSLNESQVSGFERLMKLLMGRENSVLTSVKDPDEIVRVHFFDSLSLLQLPEVSRVVSAVDIGSGAGFPGLPLAIAMPRLQISMVEANKKKSAFIANAVQELGLRNAHVLPVRAEEAGRSGLRESFEAAFARAVGTLPEVLEYSLPLLKPGGYAVLQRGGREEGDEQTAGAVARELGARLIRIQKAEPYPSAVNLHIWVFEKLSPTPSKYPRRPGMAKKRPLEFTS